VSRRPLVRLALVVALAAVLAPACSLGEGAGSVTGDLDVPACWYGSFDLKPDFFAAVPGTADAMQIRIQKGGDYETFSDGLAILVDDAGQVRGDPLSDGTPRASLLGQTLVVALPPEVRPPGVPVVADPTPALVHATLYLGRTCRTQNVALYATDAASLEADRTCLHPDGGEPPLPCPGPATVPGDGGADAAGAASVDASLSAPAVDASLADASFAPDGGPLASEAGLTGGGIGTSTIVFDDLFDGNLDESDAQKRLTKAHFEFFLVDPREICPGGVGPPPRCRGHLTGDFSFYFERGRPAQPFP
jgi:hypothetical protein